MPPEERSVESILAAAVELTSPTERQQFLEQACGDNTGLRSLVEELVQNHFRAGNFLEVPADPYGTRYNPNQPAPHEQQPSRTIGPYKLLERIGEGGFGVVYMAEQEKPVRRKVALKVLKPGMDTRQVIARFEAERQALALMDHPNIARIFDAGTTDDGRPYFVMELVKGMPITAFCDQRQLPVRERLELFVTVCQAVQHAHQKGVIHRDIKPSNVLVTLHDDTPVAKVIDFGVAKATSGQLTDKTLWTGFAQMVGTPLYMSPEQAALSGLDVDTRSDVYALGVLLYELLTGATPFDRERLARAALDEVFRIIREEEPKRPSTRVSTLGDEQSASCVNRKTEPRKLSLLLRGDLDWIVMKAIEKDRTRRYETANGLGRDVQRYLAHEVVEACPPSARYRLRKLARRYRTPLRFAVAFVALLVLAAAVSTWQAVRATLSGRQALEERDRAEASFRMARDAVDRLFTRVSQNPKLKTRGMEGFRKDLLQDAKDFYERFIREQFEAPGVRYDLGLAYQRLGEIHRELGEYATAEESLTKAVAILHELDRARPGAKESQGELAATYAALGLVYSNTERTEKAASAYRQALAIQQELAAANPSEPEHGYALAKTYSALGLVYQNGDEPERAATMCKQAQDILSQLVKDYPNVAKYQSLLGATQMNLGQVYLIRGWREQAATALKAAQEIYGGVVRGQREALPEDQQALARSHAMLGMAYGGLARIDEAEEQQQEALRIFEKLAREHSDVLEYAYDVGRCHSELGRTAERAGRFDAALAELAKAIEMFQQALDKGYLRARILLLDTRINRGRVVAIQGDHARAIEEVEASLRQGDLRAVQLYNAACAYSRASAATDRDGKLSPTERNGLKTRYADQAMRNLRQAIAKGYRNPNVMVSDPDLDPLRARKDFQKLLTDLEASGGNK
jgi:serine/threonine protein kinase/tetratricopeptide (TPR) repeat protein